LLEVERGDAVPASISTSSSDLEAGGVTAQADAAAAANTVSFMAVFIVAILVV